LMNILYVLFALKLCKILSNVLVVINFFVPNVSKNGQPKATYAQTVGVNTNQSRSIDLL
jgi:hypothetical protein